MRKGTEVKCMTDQDMLEFMRWIRGRGGECICTDYKMRVLKIIRGTKDEYKVIKAHSVDGEVYELFSVDGVLGAVNTDDSTS